VAVVGGVGAVRGADLPHPGANGGDELGEAEPGPDLDELSPAPEHLLPARERGGREQQGGRAVVHHERVLRGGAGREQGGTGSGSAAVAGSGGEVELDVGVSGGVLHGLAGGG